jgi:hypothetical protein
VSDDRSALTRFTLADRVLVAGGGLGFVDSLLPWQRRCVSIGGAALGCRQSNAWGASGAAFGALMAIVAVALAGAIVLERRSTAPPAWAGSARPLLIAGTLVFGLLKVVLVLGHFPAVGAWIGVILLAGITAGGILWAREPSG